MPAVISLPDDWYVHGQNARDEIRFALASPCAKSRCVHLELAEMHLEKMYAACRDAHHRLDANCVRAMLEYCRRRLRVGASSAPKTSSSSLSEPVNIDSRLREAFAAVALGA